MSDKQAGAAAGPIVCRIVNKRGLHARATAKLVRVAEQFNADITIEKDGLTVSGLSILGLMTLAAGQGSDVVLEARGIEAEDALKALSDLIGRGFDEEC